MDTRRATRQDLEQVGSLLEASGLPSLPTHLLLSNVIVALEGGVVLAAIALEVFARNGLLRCLVVDSNHRRAGIGASLMRSMVARAHELGLRDIYLLAEQAPGLFAAAGFVRIEREAVPSEIRAALEDPGLSPEPAGAMRLPLATRW